jgi:transposase
VPAGTGRPLPSFPTMTRRQTMKGYIGIDLSLDNFTATFLAELGPLRRFPKAKSLVARIGVDPSVQESGRYRGTSRLSKRGNRHLRRILYLIAQKLTCTTERFRQAYAHYRQQGRSHREALVIVARKILITFYAILSRHQPFQDLPIGDS